jgi:hypothetical protein
LSSAPLPQFWTFRTDDVAPHRDRILELQGVPVGHPLAPPVEALLAEAVEEVLRLAEPRAVSLDVEPSGFLEILCGEGLNASPNPVEDVAGRARRALLFALTLGDAVSRRIERLFAGGDPALGHTLDSAASVMAESLADRLQTDFEERLCSADSAFPAAVMRYSPGYCGWHLTGQRRLFSTLDPSPIGVAINEHCLMSPIKSISGVMLAGEPDIHYFKNDFAFCEECRTKTCRARIRELSRKARAKRGPGLGGQKEGD